MVPKLHFPTYFSFSSFFLIFCLFFCSIGVNAQCAGTDATLSDICGSAIFAPANQSIDLAASLGPHTAGGKWTDDDSSGGLDVVNGILNVQKVKKSGTYHFTYSLNNVNGCTDSARITITIGGYTGTGSATSACSDDSSYSLFQAFSGANPPPQQGGLWHDDTPSGGLDAINGTLNATIPPVHVNYSYTYTIGAIGTCPQVSSTVQVYISPKPLSGTASDLNLCSNNVAGYSNFNLYNLISGEDAGGTWSELSGTSEIGAPDDNFINIQNIYNTRGAGTYLFRYTVIPEHPVCRPNAISTVAIRIEELLDLTGATLSVDPTTCENAMPTNYTATFTEGAKSIANGSYEVTYSIAGVAPLQQTFANISNGKLSFPIASSNFQGAGNYAITIVNFRLASSLGACSNIMGNTAHTVLSILPIPRINNATVTIPPVCQNDDAVVTLSGNHNLTDGTYDIVYNLSGQNAATAVPAVVTVAGGIPSFKIPTALIPNSGNTTVTITNIKNSLTQCTNTANLSKVFVVNPLPNVSNLAVAIKNECQGTPVTVKLTGLGTLTDIAITYDISGLNSAASQTIPLTAVAGEVSFVIPAAVIPNSGLTTLTITNVTNSITGCSTLINKRTDFTVNAIPAIPTASDQPFCTADNATVANLQPQGSQYQWFDSVSTVPLASTKPLAAGNYSVKEVNALTGCESGLKTIAVVINPTPQINNAVATIAPICQGFDANVTFATGSTNLADGNYNIVYNLSDSNVATGVAGTLQVANGIPSFSINSSLIPKAGNTTIAITNITNTLTQCANTSTFSKAFVVNATPDVSSMVVTVKDGCLGQAVNVDITGLVNVTNITVSYAVSGANTIGSQTIPLVVSSGKTSFSISGSSLSTVGSNILTITDLTNTVNSCSVVLASPVSKTFAINGLPSNPTATAVQDFCETDLKTVASLNPNGNQYKWYDSPSSTTALPSNKLLTAGNYYVKETNLTTGCESGGTAVSVVINTVPIPVLKPNGNEFCGVDKPTVQHLTNNTTASVNFAWYDALTNGVVIPKTDLLSEGATYYGFDYNAGTQCYSAPLQVTVSLTDCTATSDNFFIPDGFSPNGDGVNDTFQIKDIEFLFPNYTLEIFNRYGNVLFKGDINKPAWDGKNSVAGFINGDAPTGVYFYIIHYNKDNLPPKQGQLYLNR